MNQRKRDLLTELTGTVQWLDIDGLVGLLDTGGYFDGAEIADVVASWKRTQARKAIKELKDPDTGLPTFISIIQPDDEGNERPVYKQRSLFDLESYRQAIDYNAKRSLYHYNMALGLQAEAQRRTGVHISLAQLALPWSGIQQFDPALVTTDGGEDD